MSAAAEVDAAALASLIEAYGSADARELIGAYFEDAPRLINAMDAQARAGDLRGLAAGAHQLKSTSMLIALTGLAALCQRIEKLGDAQAALALLAELRSRYARARTELEPHLR